ncbi:MAG TPA: translational GTPase TypA [Planctomycetota bacterium]|nr:translational GTPase TypA [Planctomycetota bacterium]
MDIRNVAIIAHVDHGKTTLVDALLRDAGVFRANQVQVDCVLDSNPLERERGITVLAKNVAVHRGDLKVNIIDTPGHADFGGEVERVLRMANGALLLVDAFDGPMPQTRYVLGKALAEGLKIIVVINKCDRQGARPHVVLDQVFALFLDLGASDEQLDFPVVYASGREGWTRREPGDADTDTAFLFDTIRDRVPPPQGDPTGAARLNVVTLDHNDFVGRIAIGRVDRGVLRDGMQLTVCGGDRPPRTARLSGLFVFDDLGRTPATEVPAGDIVAVQGFPDIEIGETLCDPAVLEPLPRTAIDEPTISMDFLVNDSPFAGREGKFVTGRQLGERLERELRSNVALRVEVMGGESGFRVSGRGVLHLGILLETMRREGYELAVSRPRVIDHFTDGRRMEPIEELQVDVPSTLAGRVIEAVCARRGDMEHMDATGLMTRLVFSIPARGLIGLRTKVMNLTSGQGVMHHILRGYEAFRGEVPHRANGVMCSTEGGTVSAYALDGLQDRGDFFVKPPEKVYEGQIVGEHCKANDISVNVCREKKLTNMRTTSADRKLTIAPPRDFSLEDALEYIEDDELVELTPKSIRLRKKMLNALDRKRAVRSTAGVE